MKSRFRPVVDFQVTDTRMDAEALEFFYSQICPGRIREPRDVKSRFRPVVDFQITDTRMDAEALESFYSQMCFLSTSALVCITLKALQWRAEKVRMWLRD